ncbi:MAG: hypothetical protein L3K06_08710, partial [Thermoplasmata archaeon]|nr:hypothetical protein [Thermoplasmata archaeon]
HSKNGGGTWSSASVPTGGAAGIWQSFPALSANAGGQVYLGWMDNRTGAYNVWAMASENGGTNWTRPVALSSYHPGFSYANRSGFTFPYGDYFILDSTADEHVYAAWGEGPDWAGPGNVFLGRLVDPI